MGYPKHLLSDDEQVLLDLHQHWIYLLPAILWTVLVLAASITGIVFTVAMGPLPPAIIGAVAVIGILLIAGIPFLRWKTTQFVLTTDRVISREGILSRKARDIPLHRINDVTFTQSFLERLIGSGNLTIESAGEHGMSRFTFIKRPEHVQNEIYKAMENYEKKPAAGEAPADDIPTQIKKLAELRDSGILTEQEFNEKKKDLLERM